MYNRSWGSHYSNGDLVLALIDGELRVVVVTKHSGDFHHGFIHVAIENSGDTPGNQDHLVSYPDKEYSGYYVGPKVGHLTTGQVMSLANGINVPKLVVKAKVGEMIHLAGCSPHPVQVHAAI